MLKEIEEEVDERIFEQVFLGKLSLSQKSNPKYQASHYKMTTQPDGWYSVSYYRKKV